MQTPFLLYFSSIVSHIGDKRLDRSCKHTLGLEMPPIDWPSLRGIGGYEEKQLGYEGASGSMSKEVLE
jgi:hypothetical protein